MQRGHIDDFEGQVYLWDAKGNIGKFNPEKEALRICGVAIRNHGNDAVLIDLGRRYKSFGRQRIGGSMREFRSVTRPSL